MDDVEAHVPGADDAEDGIEVGTVVVEKATDAVDSGGDSRDVLLEQAEGVGIGQHDAGHVLIQHRLQSGHVDAAAVIARER